MVTGGADHAAGAWLRPSWPLTAPQVTSQSSSERSETQFSGASFHSGVVFALFLSRASSWASTLRLTVLAFCIIVFSFRSQNILDLLRTKSSGKLWPTPPHRCHASIRTLNGPLKGPVQVGVRSKYPGPSLP